MATFSRSAFQVNIYLGPFHTACLKRAVDARTNACPRHRTAYSNPKTDRRVLYQKAINRTREPRSKLIFIVFVYQLLEKEVWVWGFLSLPTPF